jgi:two-component system, cell cycle sensor histidine kinase and response regulator CckA
VLAHHRRISGEVRLVEVNTGPIQLDGRMLQYSIIRDITGEEAARQEVARLAAVVESSAESIITTDLAGRVTGWNAAAGRLYGYVPAETIGRDVSELLGALTIPQERLAEVIGSGRSMHLDHVTRVSASGAAIPVDMTISPVVVDGEVVGISRIGRDLRESIAEEQHVRRSEALLADAAAIGRIGSWEIESTTGAISWSEELYRIVGLPLGGPVDPSTLVALVHPDDRDAVAAAFAASAPAATPLGFRILARDGLERSLIASRRFVPAEDGEGGREVGVVRDVTEERAVEERLRLAQRMESLGLLAGGVAHDFNNLLTAISGFADLARLAAADGMTPDEDLAQVQAAVERARELTAQLLAFGRRAMVRPRPVALGSAIEMLVPMLRRLLGEHITILTELDPDAAAVIDPGQLDQVIVNLAVNARDAMQQGGHLRIAAGRSTTHGGDGTTSLAWIEVEDDGGGIAPDLLDRIFLPFFTTKERGKGTGLGLSTAQGIVDQAGGRMEVTSRLGEGTMFRVELPGVVMAAKEEVAARGVATGAALRDALVLLVEDEDLVRRVGERVLSRAGCRVVTAATMPDAIAVADRGRPDILVTDVVLPGLGDGIALAETLRARWPDLPVLIVSGYSERLPPTWAALLVKPYHVDALVEAVRGLLDPGPAAGTSASPVAAAAVARPGTP